jgi:transposase
VTAGQVNESTQFEAMVGDYIASRKNRRRKKPEKLAGDKGYSAGRIRTWLEERRIEAVIPYRDTEKARWDPKVKFDKAAYRRRSVIEQCVGWLKEYRRVATRHEKLAVHYHGMIQLAMISRYFKTLFSDRT